MQDVELVIRIPEEQYSMIRQSNKTIMAECVSEEAMMYAIKNGTPLPKGHGRLIDADVMIDKLCTQEASEFFGSATCAEILNFIDDEKPIIKADKGRKRGIMDGFKEYQ